MRNSSISSPSITSPYVIEHQPIPEHQSIRDLGITITSNLSFHEHYKNICSKEYGSLNLIRRTFHMQSTPIVTKRNLYVTLIRSKLTYCSQLWRPRLLKDIIMLETVQKGSTKFILQDYTMSGLYTGGVRGGLTIMYLWQTGLTSPLKYSASSLIRTPLGKQVLFWFG